MKQTCDYLIIGAGIIGTNIALQLKQTYPDSHVLVIDKESSGSNHASGRNSGVLHAGFYYSEDSLKAKFCKEGLVAIKNLCKDFNLKLNECGKVVVTKNEAELQGLKELKRRGDLNGIETHIISEEELKEMLAPYKKVKTAIWCQEEPMNQGAWYCSQHHLNHVINSLYPKSHLQYAGRSGSAAPAAGSMALHLEEQAKLVDAAFTL